ncbi:MAG: response regulator [Firmicutes bacterium]|nr:response regulator [Bacillota bacterium]
MATRILIVDQEQEFTFNLQAELERKGSEVFVATERMEAQDLVRSGRPQLIVLGSIRPRGDAFKMHQWLKETPATRSLPVVVVDVPIEKQHISGWRRDEGMRLDVSDYFFRPLKLPVLLSTIEKLLDKATRKIRVLVADDHAVVREGICALVNLQRDMLIVGEAVNGRDAIEKTHQLLPNVVLMDIAMPVLNGIEAMKEITSVCEDVKVLVLSQYDDEGNIIASKEAGAFDFIPKKSVSSQLLEAIRMAC